MLVNVRGELWYVTAAGGRLRLHSVSNSSVVARLGGACPNGAKPFREPTGALDASRITMMIPDGDSPLVYDFSVPTNPMP
jgi:hypothetical protein